MKILRLLALAALGVLWAGPASAALLTFTLTGSYTAIFQVDSDPRPYIHTSSLFGLNGISGTFGGQTRTQTLAFYTSDNGGGLQIGLNGIVLASGPQLFTGTTTNPHFLTSGTFALVDSYGGPERYLLQITPAVIAAVPEPATWSMMILGFGAVGGALRRRRGTLAMA